MTGRTCDWCGVPISDTRARFCSKRHRQAAFRLRRRIESESTYDEPKRIAYADPPYPGKAARYYSKEDSYAGEVDHVELLERLWTFDGWALSTSAESVLDLGAIMTTSERAQVHVCPWVKPGGIPRRSRGIHTTWEALLVRPAREQCPGKPGWLSAQPARFGGTLTGRKPLAFIAWMFQILGAAPCDSFEDMFPGTGIVTAAWKEFARRPQGQL